MIDMSTIRTVHFIGIGGVSVSAIAEILHKNGYIVSGSDISSSPITEALTEKGIKVFKGHSSENIENIDLLIYTAAVTDENPELKEAISKGIPCLSRAEILGQIMLNYPSSIAISGTHGKTTTTSMVTRLLNDTKNDPTALVGGYFSDINSNVKIGSGEIFITEACEYKDSFLSFYPKIAVILNIDEDHLDYYKDLEHIVSSFVKFSHNISDEGLLILNGDDFNCKKLKQYYDGNIITFGLSLENELTARNIVYNSLGAPSFDIFLKESLLTKVTLKVPGQHNIYNALASFAVAIQFSIDYEAIAEKLNTFKNAGRRFELTGSTNGITVIDDYAHHPTEIKATLEAASRIENAKRIICIFQPHTYTRTKELLHEFATSFKHADEVILADIYAAREVDTGEIHSKDLLNALINENVAASYFDSFDAICNHLVQYCKKDDLVITTGAGDVYRIGKMFLDRLNQIT